MLQRVRWRGTAGQQPSAGMTYSGGGGGDACTFHLRAADAFEVKVAEWIDEISVSQTPCDALQQLEVAMVAATYDTFVDAVAQTYFETRALPMYVFLVKDVFLCLLLLSLSGFHLVFCLHVHLWLPGFVSTPHGVSLGPCTTVHPT